MPKVNAEGLELIGEGQCFGAPVHIFLNAEDQVKMMVSKKTMRAIIIDFKENKVYFGTVSREKGFVTDSVMSLEAAMEKVPDPCTFIAGAEA